MSGLSEEVTQPMEEQASSGVKARFFRGLLPALMTAALSFACGGSTQKDGAGSGGQSGGGSSGSGGGSGGIGGSSAGGSGGSGYCESFVPCCDAQGNPVDPVCPTPGNPECPAGSSWAKAGLCEASAACKPDQPCAADEYCDYPDNHCGAGSAGQCVKRPAGCDLIYAPVCTCAGAEAGNECSAYSDGSDLNGNGGCKPPVGMFECGQQFCATGNQYCEVIGSDLGGYPDTYTCKQLPAGCAAGVSCDCLKAEQCGSVCKADASGNYQLTCLGG